MYFTTNPQTVESYVNSYESQLPTTDQRLMVARVMANFPTPNAGLLSPTEQQALKQANLGTYPTRRVLTAQWGSSRSELDRLGGFVYGIQPATTAFADQAMLVFTKGDPERTAATADQPTTDFDMILGTITRQETNHYDEVGAAEIRYSVKGITDSGLYANRISTKAAVSLRACRVVRCVGQAIQVGKLHADKVVPVPVLTTTAPLIGDIERYNQQRTEDFRPVILGTSASREFLLQVVKQAGYSYDRRQAVAGQIDATIAAGQASLAA